jgi:uncharacterized protein (TIRG00374 family)
MEVKRRARMNRLMEGLVDFYRREKNKISLAVIILIIGLFALFLKDRWDSFHVLKRLSFGDVSLLAFLAVLFKLALGFNFKILVSFFNIHLRTFEWFGLTCIAAMTNYLLPGKAGTAAQAVYLKKKFNFRYTNFLSSVTGFYSAAFLVNAVIGTLLSLRLLSEGLPAGKFGFLFFLCVSLVTVFLIFAIFNFPRLSAKAGLLRDFFEGFRNFHDKPAEATGLVLSQVIVVAAIGLRLLAAFRVLGVEIDLVSSIIVALITSFSIFINLTPGALGIKEALLTFSATLLGVSPSEAVMVAMLDRVVDVIVSFAFGYAFALYLHVGGIRPLNREDNL